MFIRNSAAFQNGETTPDSHCPSNMFQDTNLEINIRIVFKYKDEHSCAVGGKKLAVL